MTWSAALIGSALARQTFKAGLVVVPNCMWTGHECDLLVITERLYAVDVEIKISRADLKVDAAKDKWWRHAPWTEWTNRSRRPDPVHRDWPPKVWKHYYALPRDIWKPELMECLGSTASGVILLSATELRPHAIVATVERRAKPNPDAAPIGATSVANVARLASLRMWDAFKQNEQLRRDHRDATRLLSGVPA